MNSSRSIVFSLLFLILVICESESLPQRTFRSNRRSAKQEEFAGDENDVSTTVQPSVYGNNNYPGYGGNSGGFGNGIGPTGFGFLPPPLMMMMMLRNAALGGGLMGPDGIDMNTVQRVLQAVVKTLQEVEQEKRSGGGTAVGGNTNSNTPAQMRFRG